MMDDLFADQTNRSLGTVNLDKMRVRLQPDHSVHYSLDLGEQALDMNALIGQTIELEYQNEIHCCYCDKITSKSYQGFCYDHFMSLAQCDSCMMAPERCHIDQGTCREPAWAEKVCLQPHYVYLANSSGIKVGITRAGQIPTRWIDQGATQGLIIARVSSRYLSGLLEVIFKAHVADKTNWRTMLKGDTDVLDLAGQRDTLFDQCTEELNALISKYGLPHIQLIRQGEVQQISYPVSEYPEKVSSLSFDKQPLVKGVLKGIKGQYLILDQGVINIRRHTGYRVTLKAS